jgi:hypothetical protein
VQELTSRIAELATDDVMHAWEIRANSASVFISASTREVYPDETAAWEGARRLWQAVLDLGHEVTDEGPSEIGVVRQPGLAWRGKVVMILEPSGG